MKMSSTDEYMKFLSLHEPQLIASEVPFHYWETLWLKLGSEVFDAGDCFQILQDEETELKKVVTSKEGGINANDGSQIYLIDHAWVYEVPSAVSHLESVEGLLDRMMGLMSIQGADNPVEAVVRSMWKFNQTFHISCETEIENKLPLWYVMDEFGSAIQHSDLPSFRTVPFAYIPTGTTFSLLFPLRHSQMGDEVTRDFVEGASDPLLRKALLLPWIPGCFRSIDFSNIVPSKEFVLQGKIPETLPAVDNIVSLHEPVKVYAEYKYIVEYLTDPKFVLVEDPEEADVLWYTSHFKDYEGLAVNYPGKVVNQFPYENILTVKSLLNAVCRQGGDFDWFLTSYNLNTELPQFISYFQYREENNLDNIWICKPWNLARGMDTHISSNIDCLIRLSTSGLKIAQKYIHRPVLFYREDVGKVKFDVRYVVLLKSTSPLRVMVYKKFFLRFSNVEFSLDDFSNYEKHFTVMNYSESPLYKLLCEDFIRQFNSQYSRVSWDEVEGKIFRMVHQLFEAAVLQPAPLGIAHCQQSRALYAIDLMLEHSDSGEVRPKLLEVNWMPDCKRACEYYPTFYNDIFCVLFLDQTNERVHEIC